MNTWERIRNVLAQRLAGGRPRQAIMGAFTTLARQHPEWTEALFDEHFLSYGAAAVLTEYLGRRRPDRSATAAVNWRAPYAYWLAEAWARQHSDRGADRRAVAQVMGVANDFLQALDEALAGPTRQPDAAQAAAAGRKARIVVRPAQAGDAPALAAMHARLSLQSMYFRYLGPYHPTARDMERLCALSGPEGATFVAVADGPAPEIVGYACYVRDENRAELAEPAVLVEDRHQRRGLGRALLNQISQHARRSGVLGFLALVHRDNAAMLRLIENSGFAHTLKPDQDAFEVRMQLVKAAAGSPEATRADAVQPRLAGDAL